MSKTLVYWLGLLIFSAACTLVFGILWIIAVIYPSTGRDIIRSPIIPIIVGAIVFSSIGIYMMKEGQTI
jgi:hypothetical protein